MANHRCGFGIEVGSSFCKDCIIPSLCEMCKNEGVKDMDKEKFIVKTTKFAELKRELNENFYKKPTASMVAGYNPETGALKSTLDKVLDILDEFVKS